jgi:hypothetical protein
MGYDNVICVITLLCYDEVCYVIQECLYTYYSCLLLTSFESIHLQS